MYVLLELRVQTGRALRLIGVSRQFLLVLRWKETTNMILREECVRDRHV
jgi:hypothetical protein